MTSSTDGQRSESQVFLAGPRPPQVIDQRPPIPSVLFFPSSPSVRASQPMYLPSISRLASGCFRSPLAPTRPTSQHRNSISFKDPSHDNHVYFYHSLRLLEHSRSGESSALRFCVLLTIPFVGHMFYRSGI